MMRKIIAFSLFVVLLAGCAALEQNNARVGDGMIKNPSLGFFGFSYEIPEGFELVDSEAKDPAECTEIQQLAIRVSEMNESYHPSGNETFYESFLMLSENTAFLLITVEQDRLAGAGGMLAKDGELDFQRQLIPLYNVTDSRRVVLGSNREEAVLTTGRAYEKKGWYYSKPKGGRMPFSYQACKVSGVNRDSYILMGFSLPEHEHVLSLQMQEMIGGFRF